MEPSEPLAVLVQTVLRSAKYKHVSPGLIQRLGARELGRRRNLREAVKGTKSKLHQIGGAYFEASVDYDRCLARLRQAVTSDDPGAMRRTCKELMRLHASTRERLAILDEFYTSTLADLPQVRTVMDLACGLNPLSRPWMPLGDDVTYLAYDIYGDLVDFIQEFMMLAGINGKAEVRDILADPPQEEVDLALVLKALPCLAQIDPDAGPSLFDALRARYLLVSFPAKSLTGREKGMVRNYQAQFETWASGRNWHVTRFQFKTELALLIQVG